MSDSERSSNADGPAHLTRSPIRIALGIACCAAAVLFGICFGLLTLLGSPQAITAATALGAMPLTAFPKVAEMLERQGAKKSLAAGKRVLVYDFRGYQIAWPLMVLYGVLVLFFLDMLSYTFANTLMGPAFDFDLDKFHAWADADKRMYLISVMAAPVLIVGCYLLGQWIGTRCSRSGVIVILLIGLGYGGLYLAGHELVGLLREQLEEQLEIILTPTPGFWLRFAISPSASILILLIGYWRGRKHRLSKYLHYLLGVLPQEDRDAIIELVVEGAQNAVSTASAVGRARP